MARGIAYGTYECFKVGAPIKFLMAGLWYNTQVKT